MKAFIKNIAFFLIPIILIVVGIESMVRTIPNSYQLKSDYLFTNSNEIETLILGSSHTFYGVNPQHINSNSFNASNLSQSPDIDYAILKAHENLFSNLKYVVIRLSYDTLFEQIKNSPEDWRLKDYKIYMNLDLDYKLEHNSEVISMGLKQSLNVMGNYYLFDMNLINSDKLGFGKDLNVNKIIDLDKEGSVTAKRHTVKNWDLLDANIKVFNNLNEWCRKNGVQVLLVTPPAYKSYRRNIDEDQLNKMIEVGKELDSKFNNCTYYNLMENKDFTAKDFYDPDHLNAKGAKKFSLIINSLIEN